jgi:hypothetical protein
MTPGLAVDRFKRLHASFFHVKKNVLGYMHATNKTGHFWILDD